MGVGFKCPHCKSNKVWKKGAIPTVKGHKVRYICANCGHSFYKPAEPKKRASKPKAG